MRREEFLSIYKEGKDADDRKDDQPDLSNGIRFRRDEEDESDFKLKTQQDTDSARPLI